MDVILLERVPKLGAMGQVVKVKAGYGRNFLLSSGKALRATEANKSKFEKERAEREARNATLRQSAQTEAKSLDGKSFVLIRQASESGQLYGSVSPRDIADAASTSGVKVERSHVQLDTPIKTIGMYTVTVAPHPEVEVKVTINVARSAAEAEAQARGEKLTGPTSDREEARAAAEALFEEEAVPEELAEKAEKA